MLIPPQTVYGWKMGFGPLWFIVGLAVAPAMDVFPYYHLLFA
jgi:hypothetical protein